MPEWLWVWGANILNRSLRKEALSCKAWNRMMVWEVLPTHEPAVFWHLEEHIWFIFCMFSYHWLCSILLTYHLQSKHNTLRECCGKTSRATGWHSVNNDEGTETDWGNLNFVAFFLSFSKGVWLCCSGSYSSLIMKYNMTFQLLQFQIVF